MDARLDQKDDGPVIRRLIGKVVEVYEEVLVAQLDSPIGVGAGDIVTAVSPIGKPRHGRVMVTSTDGDGVGRIWIYTKRPWNLHIPAICAGDTAFVSDPLADSLAGAEQPTGLRADVALMRELGVIKWKGIMLDPTWKPASLETEAKHRPAPRSEVHKTYWRKFTRASGAAIPLCSPRCQCGGWAKDQANGDDE